MKVYSAKLKTGALLESHQSEGKKGRTECGRRRRSSSAWSKGVKKKKQTIKRHVVQWKIGEQCRSAYVFRIRSDPRYATSGVSGCSGAFGIIGVIGGT